jgi:type IV secretory pathway VirB10-like protein
MRAADHPNIDAQPVVPKPGNAKAVLLIVAALAIVGGAVLLVLHARHVPASTGTIEPAASPQGSALQVFHQALGNEVAQNLDREEVQKPALPFLPATTPHQQIPPATQQIRPMSTQIQQPSSQPHDYAALTQGVEEAQADPGQARDPQPAVQTVNSQPTQPAQDKSSNGNFLCGSQQAYETSCISPGTYIETVTLDRLEGEQPFNVMVSKPLYSNNHKRVLLPTGTMLMGESMNVGDTSHSRLAVVFHSIIFQASGGARPVGWEIPVDSFAGLGQDGSIALPGKVNRHILEEILETAAMGGLAGFELSGTGSVFTAGGWGMYRQGLSEETGAYGQQLLGRELSKPPTVIVKEGTRCKVYVQKPISLQ